MTMYYESGFKNGVIKFAEYLKIIHVHMTWTTITALMQST